MNWPRPDCSWRPRQPSTPGRGQLNNEYFYSYKISFDTRNLQSNPSKIRLNWPESRTDLGDGKNNFEIKICGQVGLVRDIIAPDNSPRWDCLDFGILWKKHTERDGHRDRAGLLL